MFIMVMGDTSGIVIRDMSGIGVRTVPKKRGNMAKPIKAIILAAGMGTRMKSHIPKVLHPIFNKPMIERVLDQVRGIGIEEITCVIGHKSDIVKDAVKGVKIIKQEKPLGSADALKQARASFKNYTGDLLVMYGDIPLVKRETLKGLVDKHRRNKDFCTLLCARAANPIGYGRVVTNDSGRVIKIVEEIEATIFEQAIEEINVGAYCFNGSNLFSLLDKVKSNNKKSEFFLTDIISMAHKKNLKVMPFLTEDESEALGVNSKKDLAAAEKIIRMRTLDRLMNEGVTIVDPETAYIDEDAIIGKDTIIYPNTIIEGDVEIGKNCKIGPFARIRPGSKMKDSVEIGNFVEIVRSTIDRQSLVKHHTYLGDAVIGKNVNIGAGTITANYDGKGKYVTKIDDNAFIGSGTILIAPVRVGKNATTGAGSVVTKNHDVPPDSTVVGIPARMKNGKD